jgi:hypothetical protein
MKTTLMIAAAMTLAATASAQVLVHEHEGKAAKEQQLQILMEKTPSSGVHVSFEAKPITGAPYAADAVTEAIQVLADGNRIVRRTSARVYRDGAGRTRRETLGPDGQVTSVVISDPARGTSFVFDPVSNTAHRSSVATFVTTTSVAGGGTEVTATASGVGTGVSTYTITTEAKQHAEQHATQLAEQKAAQQHAEQKAAQHVIVTGQPGGVAGGVAGGVVTSVGPVTWVAEHKSVFDAAPTKEDLGQQIVEGVPAKGTRTTSVIAAGSIGNELPITVVSEEWTSIDLKVLVMTKHVDPRSGETTYRLTGITRGEPNQALFEPPAGVTVK